MTTDAQGTPTRTRDLARSLLFAVRQARQADPRGLVQIIVIQFAIALGLAGLLLLLRGLLGDALAFAEDPTTVRAGEFVPAMTMMVLLGTAGSVLQVVSTARQRVLAVKLDRHLVSKVLDTASRTELPEFENPKFHDRLQRAVSASRHEPAMIVIAMIGMLEAVLTVAAVAGVFMVMAWWLLPLTVLSTLPALKAARDERNARYGLHYALGENRRVREYYEGVLTRYDDAKEVRALELSRILRARWDTEYQREISDTTAVTRTHMRLKIRARLVGDLVVALVIASVWWLMTTGAVNVSTAAAGLAGLWLLSSRVHMATSMLNNIGELVLFLQDLRSFTAPGDDVDDPPVPPPPAECFRGLQADRITFTYPGSAEPVLHDVSMTVGPGEIVALVGANGSGKTTLAKILAGLYEQDTGRLLHGGTRIDDISSLRRMTTVVFQDFARYKLPAMDNIAFGRPHSAADQRQVERAAQHAGAHVFLRNLPAGYHTVLSKEFSGGTDLSGGQWQRLALARAFYRDSPFVILDEPTAALDPQAEAELFVRIRDLFKGRAVLLISHRFSSVRSADRIYVLDNGHVIEQGTHDSLMRDGGTYAHLFQLQATPYQDSNTACDVPSLGSVSDESDGVTHART